MHRNDFENWDDYRDEVIRRNEEREKRSPEQKRLDYMKDTFISGLCKDLDWNLGQIDMDDDLMNEDERLEKMKLEIERALNVVKEFMDLVK